MNRRHRMSLVVTLVLFFASSLARADVLKMVVDDTIHPIVAERIDRAIQEAQRTHADALLIEISTPGGLMTSMEEIIHKVLDSPVPVIIYVTPSGNGASSAGFFILESADVAAMAPGTNTGAAHPVLGSGATMDPVMKEKLENYAASLMRSYVSKRGRNVEVAESAVRQSKSFTAEEALSQHLVDYIAKNDDDLFHQLEGKTITRFDGQKVTLHLAGKPIHMYDMTLRQQILSRLMDPSLAALLLVLGMWALIAEFFHPGSVAPGVFGFIAILVALFAMHLLPVRYGSLIMIVAAFVLFGLEAKLQTHGVITFGGIILLVLGMLLLVDGPIPQMRVKLWAALAVAIPVGLITVFLMNLAIRARRNKVVLGERGMIGEVGTVTLPLTPSGKALVRGALWNAVSTVNAEIGQQIVVRGVENLVLKVEPLPHPAALDPARA